MISQTTTNLIDLSFLETFTKHDQSKIKRYIEMYQKSTPLVIDDLFTDLANNNFETLGLKAHSIKPQAQYMGITRLKELLIQIQSSAEYDGGHEQLLSLIQDAKDVNDMAMKELGLYLEQH